jgi:hypothetical protein
MQKLIILIVLAAAALIFSAGTRTVLQSFNQPDSYKPTQQAWDNTFKHSFVASCQQEGASKEFCSCGYDALVQLYPDFTTNKERLQRITTEGYNETEVGIVTSKCPV